MQVFQPHRILSSYNGRELLEEIKASLEAGVKKILIDFQHVLFMDSSGLGYLVNAFKQVKAVQGEFFVCSLKGQAAMLFELSHVDQFIPTIPACPNEEEAQLS